MMVINKKGLLDSDKKCMTSNEIFSSSYCNFLSCYKPHVKRIFFSYRIGKKILKLSDLEIEKQEFQFF